VLVFSLCVGPLIDDDGIVGYDGREKALLSAAALKHMSKVLASFFGPDGLVIDGHKMTAYLS
jgi:hypothetical protein